MPRRDLLRAAPDRRGCPPFPKVPEALSRASPLGLSLAAFSHKPLKNLERARGFEPPTPTLARLCSTPELHPHPRPASYKPEGKFAKACLGPPWAASCAPRHEPPAVARGSVPPARCARHRTPHLFASAGVHRRRGGGATWIKAVAAYRRRYLAALWVCQSQNMARPHTPQCHALRSWSSTESPERVKAARILRCSSAF